MGQAEGCGELWARMAAVLRGWSTLRVPTFLLLRP